MLAQVLLELIVVAMVGGLLFKFVAMPIVNRFFVKKTDDLVAGQAIDMVADIKGLKKKIVVLQERKSELDALQKEVDVTQELLSLEATLTNYRAQLSALEDQRRAPGEKVNDA